MHTQIKGKVITSAQRQFHRNKAKTIKAIKNHIETKALNSPIPIVIKKMIATVRNSFLFSGVIDIHLLFSDYSINYLITSTDFPELLS